MHSSRVKLLFSDIVAFALSGASIKVMSFFLVPLYTHFLSAEEYAVADLVTLSVQLAIPLLTLSISDAVLRFGLEAGADKESVLNVGFAVVLFGSVAAIPACLLLGGFSGDWWLACFTFLLFFVQNQCNYFSVVYKCMGQTKLMATISSVAGISVIILNVAFIAFMQLGLHGYWLGNVLGNCIGLFLYFITGGWRLLRNLRMPQLAFVRPFIAYSVPLIPNSLFWWINSSMDRFVLTALSTLSFVGLYSVASKIPQILTTVAGFFFQAWNISVFKDFGSGESVSFFKKGFFLISLFTFLLTGFLIVINVPMAHFLFSGEFYEAWKLVPLLLTAMAINILNQYLGSVFTASKETRAIFMTTALGAVVNIVLNIVLVIMFGGIGAVVATLISYLVVYMARALRIRDKYRFLTFSHFFPSLQFLCLLVLSVLSMSSLSVVALGMIFLGMSVVLLSGLLINKTN